LEATWVLSKLAYLMLVVLGEREGRLRFVLRDRDAKFSRAFDDVFRSDGIEVLITPVQAPNANAYAERWIRTVRAECLDWLLIIGRGHLQQVLRVYYRALQRPSPTPGARAAAAGSSCRTCPQKQASAGPSPPARPARRARARVPTSRPSRPRTGSRSGALTTWPSRSLRPCGLSLR
jgi:hypothetical protein